ncbi:MAG: hypothetical protein AB7N76_04085 [Planctomycetota bacterium]
MGSVALLACTLGPARPLRAQDETRAPVLVIEDLLGDDFKARKQARAELARIGARAVPAILEARAKLALERDPARALGARQRVLELDAALRRIVDVLANTIEEGVNLRVQPAAAQGGLGGVVGTLDPGEAEAAPLTLGFDELDDLGSISGKQPTEAHPKRVRARRARAALVLLGPAITGPLFSIPPLRDHSLGPALQEAFRRIWGAERALALAADSEPKRAAFRARYTGLEDLCVYVLGSGLSDQEPAVRALYQTIRDAALERAADALSAGVPGARDQAEDALFRMGPLAQLTLKNMAEGRDARRATPHGRAAAARLLRRIRYGLSRELVLRLGHDMERYAELPFQERRAAVFEIARLGGGEAIPCLRSLLREEPSLQVQLAAAVGLLGQRDPVGGEWLERHGASLPTTGLTTRELAAIHMDQGLRHLTLGRFLQAEREFRRVLEVEPRNEIAWYNLACTYSRWNKRDEAIEALRKAVACGFDDTKHMAKDQDLDNIRDDPRFKEIIAGIEKKKGLSPDGPSDGPPEAPPPPPEEGPE